MAAPLVRLKRQLCDALRSAMTGKAVMVPEAGGPLWACFIHLNGTRTYHAAGPNPISYVEIENWCRLNRKPLDPRHIDILRAMDQAWMQHAQRMTDGSAKPNSSAKRDQKLSPEFFDVLFS